MNNKISIIENCYLKKIKNTNTNKKILNFIENETSEFLKLNTISLSKKLSLSQPTISRFSWNLGFNSLGELQIYVAKRETQLIENNLNINEKDSLTLNEIIHNTKTHYLVAIEKTIKSLLNSNSIINYINTILKYQKLNVFLGIGESFLVAKYLATNIRKIGFNAVFLESIHDFYSFSSLLKEKMHITVISRSCETLEIKNIIDYMNKNHISYSLWTKNNKVFKHDSNLNILLLNSIDQRYRIGSIGSKISAFILADIVFSYLANRVDKNKVIFNNINKSIKEWNSLLPNLEKEKK
ncbi:MurR/RpiR family transcriptional regulator [Mycoplasmopsis cricetuli]|uniref:MurR/RpiR family transcriptional regulator n=1 Tax=Mycoplasmopsis cricetuli TaxID=171283 RepID=UPI00047195A6|nr:SIS domain-containing protein [Mycoplasmopsis cricetuli]